MHFRTKLLFTYSILIVLLVLILSVAFYRYSARVFEENAASNYGLLSSRIGGRLEETIRLMDFISMDLISDGPFKSSLATLASVDRNEPRNGVLINDAITTIRGNLMTYSIHKNFHAVVVFNSRGDFFSSNFKDHKKNFVSEGRRSSLPWLQRAEAAGGHPVLVSPYPDPWGEEVKPMVFSWARAMPGLDDEPGFLEVQKSKTELDAILAVPEAEFVRVFVFRADGEMFYADEDVSMELSSYYRAVEGHPRFEVNPSTGGSELIATYESAYAGFKLCLVVDRRLLLRPLSFTRTVTALLAFLIILLSATYVWISSLQLTKPLRKMQERIEATELTSLPERFHPLESPNDEVIALDMAFGKLTKRLDEAIKNELKSNTAWMRARLDSLQAQINPHFLYNILTVIAGRGLEHGDEEIADICDGIASMLRYSTSTAERSATVRDEIEHVRAYLFLMKKRLEDRLTFSIDIDPRMEDVPMPKIILQQLVENAITHGYADAKRPMVIRIDGRVQSGRWTLETADNGVGFTQERLAELGERVKENEEESRGMKIGGLGLVATHARLRLFFGASLFWEARNGDDGGARVIFGSEM